MANRYRVPSREPCAIATPNLRHPCPRVRANPPSPSPSLVAYSRPEKRSLRPVIIPASAHIIIRWSCTRMSRHCSGFSTLPKPLLYADQLAFLFPRICTFFTTEAFLFRLVALVDASLLPSLHQSSRIAVMR